MKTLLVDNGSLEPAATMALRDLASRLSDKLGRSVEPVSLLHSHKIAADKLGGKRAEIVESYLRRECVTGENEFVVLPLFFGPSRAITEYLPNVIEKLRAEFPALKVKVAPTLFQKGDSRLAVMLADRVREVMTANRLSESPVRVALVDHGSPTAAVTAVRDAVAAQLQNELGEMFEQVAPCSMERRLGSAYEFNEPLLESLLAREGWREATVIVAQLFLVPGRHAGPDGDVAQICAHAEMESPNLHTFRTEILASHPSLIDVLMDRLVLL